MGVKKLECQACNVKIMGRRRRCPLCGNELIGEELGESVFPELTTGPTSNRLALRLAVLVTVVGALVCLMINIGMASGRFWSLFVLAGLCSFWFAAAVAFYKRRNVFKLILWQVVIVSGLSILWDLFTGFHRWSLNFVLPVVCTSALLAMVIIAQVTHRQLRDYLVYLLIDLVLSFVTLVLLLWGVLTVYLPTLICLGISLLFLVAVIVFWGRTLWSELRRRMHV